MSRECEGKGLIKTNCTSLKKLGFEYYKLNRFEIGVIPSKIRNYQIPKSLAFTHEVTLRDAYQLNGKTEDSYLYSLTKSDYEN